MAFLVVSVAVSLLSVSLTLLGVAVFMHVWKTN